MMTATVPGKKDKHLSINDSVVNMRQILYALLELKNRISGEKAGVDECGEPSVAYTLANTLNSAPRDLEVTKDECLAQIEIIESHLF